MGPIEALRRMGWEIQIHFTPEGFRLSGSYRAVDGRRIKWCNQNFKGTDLTPVEPYLQMIYDAELEMRQRVGKKGITLALQDPV